MSCRVSLHGKSAHVILLISTIASFQGSLHRILYRVYVSDSTINCRFHQNHENPEKQSFMFSWGREWSPRRDLKDMEMGSCLSAFSINRDKGLPSFCIHGRLKYRSRAPKGSWARAQASQVPMGRVSSKTRAGGHL